MSLPHPAVRRVVCQYRGSDRGDHRDEGWTVWTSNDPINGALSPESHAVLLCLLEKKVDFKQVKVRRGRRPSRLSSCWHASIWWFNILAVYGSARTPTGLHAR